jgi:hypothetical protein
MTPNCRCRVAAVDIVGYDREAADATVRTTEYEISHLRQGGNRMKRFHSAFFLAVNLWAPMSTVTADDKEVAAILDKAVKALGGEDKLSKIEAVTWKTAGWMNMLFQGPEHFKCTGELTIAGLDRLRSELIMLDSGGDKLRIRSILNGDNAWLSWGDVPLKPTRHAPGLKRSLCLAMIPVTLAPLKDPRFKIEVGGDEKVGNRPAVVLNVACPDGEIIKISFDKESGLPLKAVGKALLIDDPDMNLDVFQEMIYSNYKDFGGIKTAAQVDIKSVGFNRKLEVIEFKVLKQVDRSAFSPP